MFTKTVDKIRDMFHRRRATDELLQAIEKGDLGKMASALEKSPYLDRVKGTYEMPVMHFKETYEVKGSLELAVEHDLPVQAFEMLLSAGARPLDADKPLLNSEQMRRPNAQVILDMVDRVFVQSRALEAQTPNISLAARRHRL
jgi:hypothetical protein